MKKSIIVVVNWSANNLAGSKNPLPLGMGSVKDKEVFFLNRCPNCQKEIDIEHYKKRGNCKFCGYKLDLDSSDDSSSKSKLIRTSANKIKNKGNISVFSNFIA